MADFERNYARAGSVAEAQVVDQGLRAYMLRVYNYMAIGLVITGLLAFGTYSISFVQTSAGLALTPIGHTLFGSPLMWVLFLAPLGMVFWLSFRIQHMSVAAAQTAFWVFSGLMGISLGTIFAAYTAESITRVFFITAATFGGLSLYGYTTKRDLTGWGSFLFMGLIGILIAMVVNIFLASTALQFAISVIGVLVFTGLTAYDTQKIKEMYFAQDDGTVTGRKAVMGALRLYLDFINLFLMLLRLFGNRN